MKILTFTTLFPNAVRPTQSIPVQTRLRHLVSTGRVEARVVACVPWFPSRNPRFGLYADYANVPPEEERFGIRVSHPRYLVVPKLGMSLAPFLLERAVKPVIGRMLKEFHFDLIDAHYFYPDGVAAIMLGRHFGKPVVITARGTDLNVIPEFRLPRRMIQWAARHAAGMITVSRSLKDRLVELGVPAERIEVLRNGVDLRLFRPVERAEERRRLGFTRKTLLSVGNLLPLKGHDIAVRALPMLPECDLVIVGGGPERSALEALARELGVNDRVRIIAPLAQDALRSYFGAADALVLASSREGWANVLLEAMACGTPVIASDVGGTAEVVTAPAAGVLMAERTPAALAQAVERLFASHGDRDATRRFAEQFSWDATSAGQLRLFSRILSAGATDKHR